MENDSETRRESIVAGTTLLIFLLLAIIAFGVHVMTDRYNRSLPNVEIPPPLMLESVADAQKRTWDCDGVILNATDAEVREYVQKHRVTCDTYDLKG